MLQVNIEYRIQFTFICIAYYLYILFIQTEKKNIVLLEPKGWDYHQTTNVKSLHIFFSSPVGYVSSSEITHSGFNNNSVTVNEKAFE